MSMNIVLPRVLLGLSGLLLFVIGASVLFDPVGFAAANSIRLPVAPSVLSEARAPGGLLLVSAVVMLLGAVRADLTAAGLALAALVYCSYGAARLVGVALDGMPSAPLTQALFVELAIGSLCLGHALWLYRIDRGSR